jgi:hypothetical protein
MRYDEEALEEIQSDMDTAMAEINAIKDQLTRAKAEKAVTGKPADAAWFSSANAALKHKQLLHQQLQTKLATFKRRAKLENSQSFERTFVLIAKKMLRDSTYQKILNEVHRIEEEKNDVARIERSTIHGTARRGD